MTETTLRSNAELAQENEALRAQLAEAQEVIRAIQAGEVDAVVVSGPQGEQVFTLRGAEYAYRALVEAMNEGAASLASDGTVLYSNQRLADLCGVPLERILGKSAELLLSEDSRTEYQSLLASALQGEAAKSELRLRSGRESTLPVYVSLRRFKTDDSNALCMVITDLSEQRKQRELLRAEEELRKQAEVMKLSYDAIIIWRAESGIESWNVGAERLYGYSEREVLGKITHELLKTVHPTPWAEIKAELFANGFWEGELRHTARDGREVIVSARKQIVRDSDGLECVLEVNRDITERKRAEDAVAEARLQAERSAAQLRTVLDSMSERLYVCDYQGKLLVANASARSTYSVDGKADAPSLLDMHEHIDVFDMHGRKLLPQDWPISRVLAGEFLRSQEVRVRFKQTGVEAVLSCNGAPIRERNGKLWMAVLTSEDITERKNAEQELRRSKERLELAVQVANLGEWEVNLIDRKASQSERHAGIFGYEQPVKDWSLEKFLGHVLSEDRREAERNILRCLSEGSLDFETRIRRTDGETRWIWVRGRVWPNTAAPIRMFGTVMDITDRKQVEQSLIQSEKLASVGRLASTIAHEINNPLETIGNAVFLALTDKSISEDVKQYLELATQELERVTHVARQTLSFHRSEKKTVAIDPRECVDGLLKLFIPRLSAREITVVKRFAEAPRVMATSGELQQVISNLLMNSMDAMANRGTIYLRVSPAVGRDGGEAVRFTIADTGSGIAADRLKRVFEAFFTTKEMVGTGLGLWVTKEIVEKYGGTIKVRSRVGSGTVFSIVFPAAPQDC